MEIRFSVRYTLLLLLLHILVATAVWVTMMPLWAKLAILLMIVLNLIYYLARDVFLLRSDSWQQISLDQDSVTVITQDGTKLFGQPVTGTTVCSYCVVLRVKLEGHQQRVSRVIFPDALSEGLFRELCVRLKFA